MTSQEIKARLIQLAAKMVCGEMLPQIDTDKWYVSTPLAERQRIRDALDAAHENHKRMGLEIRDLADAIARRTTMQSAQTVRDNDA